MDQRIMDVIERADDAMARFDVWGQNTPRLVMEIIRWHFPDVSKAELREAAEVLHKRGAENTAKCEALLDLAKCSDVPEWNEQAA